MPGSGVVDNRAQVVLKHFARSPNSLAQRSISGTPMTFPNR
jgi:hypothetical protein